MPKKTKSRTPPRQRAARLEGRPSRAPRGRSAPTPVLTVEFGAVTLALLAGALLFWRAASDPFGVPRWTVLVLIAVFALGAWLADGLRDRMWPILPRPAWWILTSFVIAALIATVVAPDRAVALYGVPFRQNGALSYAAYIVLFVAAAQVVSVQWRHLATVLGVLAMCVVGYGLIQWAGWDPFSWPNAQFSTWFSTLGQVNFASGYVAIVIPFLLLVVLRTDVRVENRVGAAVVIAAAGLYLYVSRSFQGFPAGLAGVVPLLLVAARGRRVGGRSIVALGAGAAVAIAVVVLIVPPTRDYIHDNLESGFEERLLLWDASGDMVREDPVLGKGFSAFAEEFTVHRSARHARLVGPAIADEPHSVPIEMAVHGGALLLLIYLAFIGYVGVTLVRALTRQPSMLLAAFGGAWLAYQVQSLVSFDAPSLASLHWILAGAIVALARESTVESVRRPRETTGVAIAIGAGAVVVLGIWLSAPLRADVDAHRAGEHVRTRQLELAEASYENATELAPWNGVYWANLATTYHFLGRDHDALVAAAKAIEHSPGSISYVLTAAGLAAATGRDVEAARWYELATRTDPRYWQVWTDYAEFELNRGRPGRAIPLARRANGLNETAEAWDVLADAYGELGRERDAEAADRHARELRQ